MGKWGKFLVGFSVVMSTTGVFSGLKAYNDLQKVKGVANITLENQALLCKLSIAILNKKEDKPLVNEICAKKKIISFD